MSEKDSHDCGCNCEDLHVHMYALLDRELTEVECARLNAHIAQCPGCAEMIAAEESLRRLLKKCCCGPAPASLREKISYSIQFERTTIITQREL